MILKYKAKGDKSRNLEQSIINTYLKLYKDC